MSEDLSSKFSLSHQSKATREEDVKDDLDLRLLLSAAHILSSARWLPYPDPDLFHVDARLFMLVSMPGCSTSSTLWKVSITQSMCRVCLGWQRNKDALTRSSKRRDHLYEKRYPKQYR